jgi:hypothetical protein
MIFGTVYDLPCGASLAISIAAEFEPKPDIYGQEKTMMIFPWGGAGEIGEEEALKQYDRWNVVSWHAVGTAFEVKAVTKKGVQEHILQTYELAKVDWENTRKAYDDAFYDSHGVNPPDEWQIKDTIVKHIAWLKCDKELDCIFSFYRAIERYQNNLDTFEIVPDPQPADSQKPSLTTTKKD